MRYLAHFCLLTFVFGCFKSECQVSPDLLTKKWAASWVTVPGESAHDYGVFHFKKTIELESLPSQFNVHISGDNRYKFYVNDTWVAHGPARSDLYHWNYETVNIVSFLKPGKNELHAIVWNFGDQKPEAQISFRTAFILQGNSDVDAQVNTNKDWLCKRDQRYKALPPDLLYTYYVSGPGEDLDFTKMSEPVSWLNARELGQGIPKGVFDWSAGWMLVPRQIPSMEIRPQRLKSVRIAEGITPPKKFPEEATPVTIGPNKTVTLLLDQGFLTNAYPELKFHRGKNAVVTMRYAEALYIKENGPDWKSQRRKENRDEVEGKRFVGVIDRITADGNAQTFSPLWWRTYRYIELRVETKEEALVIDDLQGFFTGYPFILKSAFASNEPVLHKIHETGWRTARLCAGETYMDCPYYEQLQYIGDTRIQALISLYNSGDDRLIRQAIDQLDHSRMAEGITLSRFPSATAQQIPTFSLWWIGMLHDFYWYRGDDEYIRHKLPAARQVLEFFHRYQSSSGSLKNPPYWEFTDWAEGKGWDRGVGPSKDGVSAMLDLQLCIAYQLAAELERALGMESFAILYENRAHELSNTIVNMYWDNRRKLFSDTPDHTTYSQHTNALAILAGVKTIEDRRDLMQRTLTDTSLTQATIYFKYYLHRAVHLTGLGDQYLELLDDWKIQLRNGLTTWAEISDHTNARSDCHAWGASPSIEFFRIVLGIDSGGPGFKTVAIEPHLGSLTQASGKIPHAMGDIFVRYVLKKGMWKIKIDLPRDLQGNFTWRGESRSLHPGENLFDMKQ